MVFRILALCLMSTFVMAAKPAKVIKEKKMTTWEIDSSHSSVNFKVKHLGVSTVRGSFSGVTGEVKVDENNILDTQVSAKIDVNSVDTGTTKRDEYLKAEDFFNVLKFPVATFVSTKLTRDKDGKLNMTGKLTLREQTRDVTLQLSEPSKPIKNSDGDMITGISATTMINRQDFELKGIVTAGNEVQIEIELELKQVKKS